MNSHIFPNHQQLTSGQAQSADLPLRQPTMVQWLSMLMLIAVVILFPERPAWGSEVDIEAGPAGIKGVAHNARLGEVLEVLADETGYTVYLDKAVAETEVNFNIPHPVPAERAIRIILHPHSHALVYAKTSEPLKVRIDQIQIYYRNPAQPVSDPETAPQPDDAALSDDDHDNSELAALSVVYSDE